MENSEIVILPLSTILNEYSTPSMVDKPLTTWNDEYAACIQDSEYYAENVEDLEITCVTEGFNTESVMPVLDADVKVIEKGYLTVLVAWKRGVTDLPVYLQRELTDEEGIEELVDNDR